MIYWFAVDPDRPDDLEVGLRNSLWGVPEEGWDRIEPVEPGDSVLFYHRDHGFVLCDVDSEPYTESIPVWSDVDYPHRVRLSDPVETDRYVNLGEIFDCLHNRETGEPFEGVAEAEAALGGEEGMFRPLTDDEVRCLFGRLGWNLPAGVSPPPEPEEPEEPPADDVDEEAGEEGEAVAAESPAAAVRGRRVILAPAAGNTASQERYEETITEGVGLDLLEGFLPEAQMEVLREALGSGQAHVWGTPPAQDHANRTQWEASGPGDVILFTGGGHVFASASVILTRLDEGLAEELWGRREDGTTWKFLYFVTAPVEQDVPYDELNAVAGYEPAYRIPRLNVLAPERSGRVLEAFPGFGVSRRAPGEDQVAAVAASDGPEEEAGDEEAAVEEEGAEPEPAAETGADGEEEARAGQATAGERADDEAAARDGEPPREEPEAEAAEAEAEVPEEAAEAAEEEPVSEPGPTPSTTEEAPPEEAEGGPEPVEAAAGMERTPVDPSAADDDPAGAEASDGAEAPEEDLPGDEEADPAAEEEAAPGEEATEPQEDAGPDDESEPAESTEAAGPEAEVEPDEEPGPAEPVAEAAPGEEAEPEEAAESHIPRIRDLLFGQRDLRRCGLCGRLLPVDLLEVVFIKPLEACTEIETMDLENDVMAACGLGCAALFREGFLVVDDGEVAAGRIDPRTDPVDEYVEELAGNRCEFWHAGSVGYFRWHAREIGGA